jgi:hypothetical protein
MIVEFSIAEQQEWVERNRSRVEERTGAPVIAYSTFYRTGSWGQMGLAHVSPLAKTAVKLLGKRKAGGLPPHFILALTEDRLHAFKYKARRDVIEVEEEVAVWERSAIRASAQETSLTMRLTIESPGDGASVVCDSSKADITSQFLSRLGAMPAVAA